MPRTHILRVLRPYDIVSPMSKPNPANSCLRYRILAFSRRATSTLCRSFLFVCSPSHTRSLTLSSLHFLCLLVRLSGFLCRSSAETTRVLLLLMFPVFLMLTFSFFPALVPVFLISVRCLSLPLVCLLFLTRLLSFPSFALAFAAERQSAPVNQSL